MQRTRILPVTTALAIAFGLVGCSSLGNRSTRVEAGGEVAPAAVTPVDNRTIPVGATLVATLDQTLGTNVSKTGDTFSATVSNSLYAQDGSLVVPAGAKLEGRVTALDASSNATQPALIRLAFDRIRFNSRAYPFSADIVQSNPVQTGGTSSSERTKQIVIGGAVGAALGALVSGNDVDKIVIGGALGAAAGSIISLGKEVDATLPSGSQMTVRATNTTTLR